MNRVFKFVSGALALVALFSAPNAFSAMLSASILFSCLSDLWEE